MNAPKYAWFVFIGIILSIFVIGYVYAEPISDCSYVPRQSDEVIVTCGSLKGQGVVSIRLCGINYAVEVKCS
jgi:hypothetical protein